MNRWVNFLSLIPGTTLTILIISIAFLRFYDETDFTFLGQLTSPRLGRNRLTVAAILVALVNFGIVERSSCAAWDRRNRETDRLAEEEQRRTEEGQRRAEEEQRRREDRTRAENERAEAGHRRAEAKEQATRRARVEIERDIAFLSFLADPSEPNQQRLSQVLALLNEYRDTLA
jgi:flagellar biosynthesis/type III secretory pathway M-ring protein FliF/YscJ